MNGVIVVGIDQDVQESVLTRAAVFARRFDADLVCVLSDPERYAIRESAGGLVTAMDIDADDPDEHLEEIGAATLRAIESILAREEVAWTARAVAGDPAAELARIAHEVAALMIVVGTRRPGAWGSVREFLNGSVAARLAHRQGLPVVLVPLTPVDRDDRLPWSADD